MDSTELKIRLTKNNFEAWIQTSVIVSSLLLTCYGVDLRPPPHQPMNKKYPDDRREEPYILDYLGAINHFHFSDTVQSVAVPDDIKVISVQMWGGGGYGEGATLGKSGAFVHSCLFVSPQSRIDVIVGMGGGYPSRLKGHIKFSIRGRQIRSGGKGRAKRCENQSDKDGGESVLQIDGEDVLTAAGGRASSDRRNSMMNTSTGSGQCHGQHSRQYDPTACGLGGSESSGVLGQHGLVVIEVHHLSPTIGSRTKQSLTLPSAAVDSANYSFSPCTFPYMIPPSPQPTPQPSVPIRARSTEFLSPAVASFLLTIFILFNAVVFIISICYYSYAPCDENENENDASSTGILSALVMRRSSSVSLPVAVATSVPISNNPVHNYPQNSRGEPLAYIRVVSTEQYGDLIDSGV